jgi:hypothetical protein
MSNTPLQSCSRNRHVSIWSGQQKSALTLHALGKKLERLFGSRPRRMPLSVSEVMEREDCVSYSVDLTNRTSYRYVDVFQVRIRLISKETVGSGTIPAGEPVTLFIKAAKHQYDFACQLQGDRKPLGSVPTSAFVPLFTGVHLGLYAQGANEIPCRRSAFFRYAKWDA